MTTDICYVGKHIRLFHCIDDNASAVAHTWINMSFLFNALTQHVAIQQKQVKVTVREEVSGMAADVT